LTAEEAKALGIVDLTCTSDDLIKSAQRLASKVQPGNEPIDRTSLHDMKCDEYRDVLKSLADEKKQGVGLSQSSNRGIEITGSKL